MIFHHTSLVGLLGGLDSRDRSLLQRSSKCASEAWKNWFLAALAKNQSTHRDRVLFWMGWSIKTDIFVYKDWMLHDHILGLHEIPSLFQVFQNTKTDHWSLPCHGEWSHRIFSPDFGSSWKSWTYDGPSCWHLLERGLRGFDPGLNQIRFVQV